jgi:DNA invertase Pin-like site-specific DNA recombinase
VLYRNPSRNCLEESQGCCGCLARKRVVIYARTSTGDGRQHLENQIRALREVGERLNWNVVEIITDEISGLRGRDKRPGFDRLHKGIAMAEWDLIACFAVDRLGRSIQDLLAFLTEAHERGIGVFCLQNGFDSSTASGRLMAGLLGLFASYETEILRERIRAGLARVKAEGKKIGRPRLKDSVRDQIAEGVREGLPVRAISRATGVAPITVRRVRAETARD